MKVKNLVLFGFVLSALSYLNEQAKNEDNNDFDFLNNLEDVDLDKIRKEFGDGLENVVGEFGDVVSSIVKIGSEAFDRYLQNYENGGEETLKKIKEVIDENQQEQDEEVPLRSFFEEKEPDSWAVDLDSFLRGSDEVENKVLTDLTELLNELGETQEEVEKTEEDYLREIEKAVGAQQPEGETSVETSDEPLMPEMSDAESDEIDALFSEIIAGEKEAETEKEIQIMDGFEGLEEPAVAEPVTEEPIVEEPEEPVQEEVPVYEEPEVTEPAEEPVVEEEPVEEPTEVVEEPETPVEEPVEEPVETEPEVPTEEPVEEPEPEITEPVEEPAQEPEEIPVETEVEEPQPETEEPEEQPIVIESGEELIREELEEEKAAEEPEDRIEIKIEEAPKYQEEDIYAKINDLYPYLSLGFIRSVYELKEVIAEEYPLDKEVIVLHRIRFASVDDLRQFVEIVSNHGYNVNVDENQCIVDIFKQYRNTDGRILTNIFEIANQARLLRGQYEGYRIDVVNEED
ncbi:MAG: hypothetical protein Q4F09_01755 [Erysipelotrichaceae bacterium]|nr:hypothetical protein [Erysipelotrichaceae bacterium]